MLTETEINEELVDTEEKDGAPLANIADGDNELEDDAGIGEEELSPFDF